MTNQMIVTEFLTGITRNGSHWVPQFVQQINTERCIGCGRCSKVCGRGVMLLMAADEHGALIEMDGDEEEEFEKKVMALAHPENCIGCEACARVCSKKCYTHGPEPAVRS